MLQEDFQVRAQKDGPRFNFGGLGNKKGAINLLLFYFS